MKIAVLYTRLTGYWMACMRHDVHKTGNEYLVIRKSPSPEAPFVIKSEKGIEIIDGDHLNVIELQSIINDYSPSLLYVTGWSDKRYLQLSKDYKDKGVPVITGMDNQWLGTLRQYVGVLLSNWKVLKYFTHIWVPGDPQYKFAKKLGFKTSNILRGLYCADETKFQVLKQDKFVKQIIFVGRLVEHKGLKILFRVLQELISENKLTVNVKIIGNGPLQSEIPNHKNITHIPFVAPDNLPHMLENAGFFALPSIYEAWGVVVHEAVLAGLPIISTRECGASSAFLKNKENGFVYDANNEDQLKEILLNLDSVIEEQYFDMSKKSRTLADTINLDNWSETINSVSK